MAEIPQVLIEFDPSYMITKDLKVWTSFRYFGKTYANINEAYYFNGHWETLRRHQLAGQQETRFRLLRRQLPQPDRCQGLHRRCRAHHQG